MLHDLEAFLNDYSARGEEQARQAKEDLFGIQNSRKAYIGRLGGLKDEAFMASKKKAETELRERDER